MEGYMEQPPSGSSGCHLSCKKARISPADSCHGKDVRSIAREPSKNPIGNAFWDDRQQYQEILRTPQSSSLSMMVGIDLTGPQEFGSHSHVSQDWQASVSNSMHLSNWNGCQTLVDDPNSRWNPSVCNSGGVQNSDLTTPVQLSQGAMETSNLTAMGSYQSSSSGNLRVEDNVNFVPSNHETLDNNHIRNVDIAEAIQPSSSIPEDNYIASTSVAPNLLFNIITLSPNCAFSGDHIKVCIIGRFLISPEEVQKYKWACVFGGVEVPAKVIIDGVLQCQTPSCGNGIVQLFVTCSNGLRCSEVREFEFLPIQVVDVREDMGSAKTQQYIIRLQTLLYLESNTSRAPIERWKAETFKLCGNVCALLEDDSKCKKLVNFTKLVKSLAHDVKDLCIQNKLRKQLRFWLLQKIAEHGVGADTLDGEGQGVLHLVAALGYDWAIKPIVDARIISIDLLDVNQDTALDWASRNGRNHTVKLLKSYGATPRCAREPIPSYPSIVGLREPIPTNPDFKQIQQMAKSGWLPPSVICGVLGNHQQYTIETESPTRPPSGSLFLFDRSIQPRYRNDGHKWLKESHSEIKDFDLYCCYARGKENKHFYRRCYRMKGASSNIVLVHYLEVKASTSRSKHGSNLTGDHNSDDNPDLGREHYHYPSSGLPVVNQTTKPNGANQMEQFNAGGLQNSCLIGSGRVQHTLKLLDATSTEYSSESSFDGNFNVEDSDDSSSSKHILLDGPVGDDIVMIDSLDCCTSDQLEDVTEKTIQPCSWKGTDRSEDGDEKTPEGLSSSFGHQGISSYHLAESITLRDSIRRNQGKAVVTVSEQSATPLDYDDHEFEPSDDHARSLLLQDSKRVRVHMAAVRIQNRFRSWKVRKELLLTRQQIIKIQDSSQSRSDLGKGVVTVPEQSATPVGVGYNVWKFFGVSDDHVLSLLRLRTNKAGQYSEPVHAAAVRIQNKYRSWKGRNDFLLTRQQIIKIQARVRGYQVRVKKALDAIEISMVDSMNVPSEVRANKGTNQSIISTMKMITEMVSEKPVVLFTKATCCISHTIKSLIVNFGVNPTIYELDNIPAGPKIEQVLSRLGCNPASLAIFIWGEFVGGANEILSLHLKGSLKLKLQGERGRRRFLPNEEKYCR